MTLVHDFGRLRVAEEGRRTPRGRPYVRLGLEGGFDGLESGPAGDVRTWVPALAREPLRVVVDLSGVRYYNELAPGIVNGTRADLEARGGALHLAAPPRKVGVVLRMFFEPFFPAVADAVAALDDPIRAPLGGWSSVEPCRTVRVFHGVRVVESPRSIQAPVTHLRLEFGEPPAADEPLCGELGDYLLRAVPLRADRVLVVRHETCQNFPEEAIGELARMLERAGGALSMVGPEGDEAAALRALQR